MVNPIQARHQTYRSAWWTAALVGIAAMSTLVHSVPAAAQQDAPRTQELITDTNLTGLSVPHVHVCQRGFEGVFGIPEGVDPDDTLIVHGARQTVVDNGPLLDAPDNTLEIAMPYERVLPPGPPSGAVIRGKITCYFVATEAGSFPLTPDAVVLEEDGTERWLDGPDLALFR